MKILLIHPPSKEMYQRYLPLGLAYIAGSLLKKGYDVTVWDIDGEGWSRQDVTRKISGEAGEYSIVGLTALAGDYPYVKWLSGHIKEEYPEVCLILGGYLASALPEFLIRELPLDYIVIGEGEETVIELADLINRGLPALSVKGICFLDEAGRPVITDPGERINDLDQLPLPPWEQFPMEAYLNKDPDCKKSNESSHTIISIMASRGCPFDCDYCDHTIKGYKPRYRSVHNVIEEIKLLLEDYGDRIDRFYFWDDILIWDRNWTVNFCETLIKEDLNIEWTCNGHVSRIDPLLMDLLRNAGCRNIRFGIESGSQAILDSLNKGVKVEKALESLKICLRAGLELTIYTMIGMKGENRETVNETLDFFRSLITPLHASQLKNISFFMLTPFPGTRLFKRIRKEGFIGNIGEFLERDCDAYHDIPLNISGQEDHHLLELKKEFEKKVTRMLQESRNDLLSALNAMARKDKK